MTITSTQEQFYCPRCQYTWWYKFATGPEFESRKEDWPDGATSKLCPAHQWAQSRQQR